MANQYSTCSICGGKLIKNGENSSGRSRWRCKECGTSVAARKTPADVNWLAGSTPSGSYKSPTTSTQTESSTKYSSMAPTSAATTVS
ncbi:transposase-like zinc-binding domain-containing protein [Corynebacterium stationis]|uniref:transposase-like zinc-binding domain-containing protein n=1 Tax=Corynebacterium stationis TaxID=1705 RepID=UPI00406C87B2